MISLPGRAATPAWFSSKELFVIIASFMRLIVAAKIYFVKSKMLEAVTMKDPLPRYTLRIEQTDLDKLAYIAESNGRSKNREIEMLIRQHIRDFEKKHGKIEIGDT